MDYSYTDEISKTAEEVSLVYSAKKIFLRTEYLN